MTDLVERLNDLAGQRHRDRGLDAVDDALRESASRLSQQDAELERLRREVEEARAALKPFADCARELPDPRVIVEAHPEWKRCERRFHGAVGKLQVRDFRNAYSAFAHQTLKDEVRG